MQKQDWKRSSRATREISLGFFRKSLTRSVDCAPEGGRVCAPYLGAGSILRTVTRKSCPSYQQRCKKAVSPGSEDQPHSRPDPARHASPWDRGEQLRAESVV